MQKAVEQTLADLGWAPALVGPRVGTRCVVGGWLALRAEVSSRRCGRRSCVGRNVYAFGGWSASFSFRGPATLPCHPVCICICLD